MKRQTWLTVTMAVFAAPWLVADAVPGRWEKVASLEPGTEMDVTLASGDEIRGAYVRLEEDAIVLNVQGRERITPRAQIARIERTGTARDRLRDGSLLGAAAGAAAGMGAVYGYHRSVNGPGSRWSPWREENLGLMIAGGVVGAGIGAVLGAVVDSRVVRQEVLYRAR